MRYKQHSFRHAAVVLEQPQFTSAYKELMDAVSDISEDDIIRKHEAYQHAGQRRPKSISMAINALFRERLVPLGWHYESPIFQEAAYSGETWRLDFAKEPIAVEVAFNHSTVIAWNLIKPVLSSELNHVKKAIQTQVGVIISATNNMRIAGGFDGAIGTYEKFLTYLRPLNDILSVPILLIGLEAPVTFRLEQVTMNSRKEGYISMITPAVSPTPLGVPPTGSKRLAIEPLFDEPDGNIEQ